MHALCVWCGGTSCTCFDTDEEYEAERRKHMALCSICASWPLDAGQELLTVDGDEHHPHCPFGLALAKIAALEKAMETVACMYCGAAELRRDDPQALDKARAHTRACPQHPLGAALRQIEALTRAGNQMAVWCQQLADSHENTNLKSTTRNQLAMLVKQWDALGAAAPRERGPHEG
jgi:hypothetical protein